MKFAHGVGHKGVVDNLEVSGGCIEEAGCGDVVDLSRDTACIVMDEGIRDNLRGHWPMRK